MLCKKSKLTQNYFGGDNDLSTQPTFIYRQAGQTEWIYNILVNELISLHSKWASTYLAFWKSDYSLPLSNIALLKLQYIRKYNTYVMFMLKNVDVMKLAVEKLSVTTVYNNVFLMPVMLPKFGSDVLIVRA